MNNKKIYLHIGLEKTGSTFIQSVLFANKEALYDGGIEYPDGLFRYENMMELTSAYADEYNLINVLRPKSTAGFRKELVEYILSKTESNIVFSSEHLSSRLQSIEQVYLLLNDLKVANHEIIILAYVRSPKEWVISQYCQYIKSGGKATLSSYLSNNVRLDTYIKKALSPASNIKMWLDTKLISSAHIEKYEDAKKFGLINSFKNIIGINILPLESPNNNTNPSLNNAQTELLRLFNNVVTNRFLRKILVKMLLLLPIPTANNLSSSDSKLIEEYMNTESINFKKYLNIEWP
ncbi:MAG: hypothetical protein ACI9YE_001238 [Psychroserpens sp.]|jgi:hypothetical protein